ncbi:outer membrane biogenesis protein BamB [Anatilimnocola aggregata]|uniref:Outer membrane biogenesis protein BamB n=1 Tax=Anatilimnocola aggregata TaxID=2528021 RepID=A0A517Y8I0_9BACT|nr:PQQ-binding-like beta-propeller repeat protein [Anatilimnocola aggregata]QDU26505.1 outer membrane biogenesis protein BamB [Anatilimnocola aggregata]
MAFHGRLALALVVGLLWMPSHVHAENWPSFRGPTGMGLSQEKGLPLTWNAADGSNVLWKSPLPATLVDGKPDHNQSSPIVWQDRVFVTTAYWPADRKQEEQPEQRLTCYRLIDGEQLWDTAIPTGPWTLSDRRGGYAAPTPVTDGERVYVLFGSSLLAAVDFAGKIVWQQELADWQAFDVAIASSPILHRGQLLVLADRNQKKSSLTAYDPATGKQLWEQKRTTGFTHTTPVIVEVAGRAQLLVTASSELQGLDPANGEKLWWCKTPGDVTSPVFADGLIYTDSGRGGPGILVAADGQGDVAATHVKWKLDQIPEGLSSPAIAAGHLYRLHNPGVLKCVNLATGTEQYATRLNGVSVSSSPIVTPDGRLYFASAGKTFVVQSGPKYELLATNDLGDASSSSAAASNGRLIFKGKKYLFCVGQK